MQTANDRIAGFRTHAAYLGGLIPALSTSTLSRAGKRLNTRSMTLASVSARRITPGLARLDSLSASLSTAARSIVDRNVMKLDNYRTLTEALAPEATLRRGYTITRINGKIVTSASQVPEGAVIITTTADGSISSTANYPPINTTTNDSDILPVKELTIPAISELEAIHAQNARRRMQT